jgi:hypothetical protein
VVEFDGAIDHDFEPGRAQFAHAAGMLGAQRNHQRLARDSERVGHDENALDLGQSNRFEQGCLLGVLSDPSLHMARLA